MLPLRPHKTAWYFRPALTQRSAVSTTIPTSIDEVTAPWLSAATGWDVSTLAAEQIGVGVGVASALYRATLTGQRCPASVIIKLPALDEAAVFTSTMLRMYIREVGFFRSLVTQSPLRAPKPFVCELDEETSEFVLVMEDLGELRSVDQVSGMSLEDARTLVKAIAGWHAKWWGQGEALAAAGRTLSLNDPIYHAVLPVVYAEGWEKINAEMTLPASVVEVGARWIDALPAMLARLGAAPTTMLHGDLRADNVLFEGDGSAALIDFQILGSGTAAYDLSYFITQSLDAELASAHERELFDLWVNALLAAGVPPSDTEHLWDDYRLAAAFCVVYPVVAVRGMDLNEPRQRALIETMSSRLGRAIDELGLADLIG